MNPKCIWCETELITKAIQPYKRYYMCNNSLCPIITIIVTSTIKGELDEIYTKKTNESL